MNGLEGVYQRNSKLGLNCTISMRPQKISPLLVSPEMLDIVGGLKAAKQWVEIYVLSYQRDSLCALFEVHLISQPRFAATSGCDIEHRLRQ